MYKAEGACGVPAFSGTQFCQLAVESISSNSRGGQGCFESLYEKAQGVAYSIFMLQSPQEPPLLGRLQGEQLSLSIQLVIQFWQLSKTHGQAIPKKALGRSDCNRACPDFIREIDAQITLISIWHRVIKRTCNHR